VGGVADGALCMLVILCAGVELTRRAMHTQGFWFSQVAFLVFGPLTNQTKLLFIR
jgi:hypothetical protein